MNLLVNTMITIKEEIMAKTDDQTFTIFCEKEINKILDKDNRDKLDYLKFYVFLHLLLEIKLSFIFRLLISAHVFLKTSEKNLTIEDMDKKDIKEKFNLLSNFLSEGITQNDIDKLNGWFNNLAEKRNKIAHGYENGITYGKTIEESKIVSWGNDNELKNHFSLYCNIITLLRDCIDKLPALTPTGKKDFKKELIDFSITF